jgi:TRAP-type C4-dicarboxylate transport system permease small subunit
MKKLLDYYYYRFNKTIWFNKEDKSSYINTYIGISTVFTLNIFTILLIMGFTFSVIGMFSVFIILTILSYFYYIYGGRWKQINDKYNKNDPYPILGHRMVIIYFVLTFISWLVTLYMKKHGII